MGIDPESDVSILVLCFKLGAKDPGQISKEVHTSKNSLETLLEQFCCILSTTLYALRTV
jgi:hypothetical protein